MLNFLQWKDRRDAKAALEQQETDVKVIKKIIEEE